MAYAQGPTPATSTDNAIVRWDGATGQLVQNSGVTIDDSNNIVTPGTVLVGRGIDTIQAANLQHWYRAGVGETLSGGVLSSWANAGLAGGNLVQGAPGNRPTPVTYGLRAGYQSDGADYLVSDLAASAWPHLHDGTGSTTILVVRSPTASACYFFDTGYNGNASTLLYWTATQWTWFVRGTGADVVNATHTATGKSRLACLCMRLKSGATRPYSFRLSGQGELSGALGAAVNVANPPTTLAILATAAGANAADGAIFEFANWNTLLTDQEVDAAMVHLISRYNIV